MSSCRSNNSFYRWSRILLGPPRTAIVGGRGSDCLVGGDSQNVGPLLYCLLMTDRDNDIIYKNIILIRLMSRYILAHRQLHAKVEFLAVCQCIPNFGHELCLPTLAAS